MKFTRLFLVFTLLLSTSAFSLDKDPVVANVNGTKIKVSELEKRYHQNLLYVSDKVVTRESVLTNLINRALGIQKAKQAKLEKNPIVKEKMEDILYHAQISKDLEGKFKTIVVKDEDLKSYYQSYPEYKTSHILFRVKVKPAKFEAEEALKAALKVYKLLQKKPEKFSELASKYSQSSTAPQGGDMGYQPAVRMAPEYFHAIKGKKDGYLTPPVRTQFGYHIIKVTGKKEFSAIEKPVYSKIAYDRKRDKILRDYFQAIRDGAKIKVEKKYLAGPSKK
jgi:parvulin-like peptidyl-prolyl isomerase